MRLLKSEVMKRTKKKTAKKPSSIINEDGTRDRLLKVATELFAKQGFDATSTAEICQLAKANVAAITYHFGTKDNLYNEVLRGLLLRNHPSQIQQLTDAHSLDEFKVRLRVFAEGMIGFFLQNPEVSAILFRDAGFHKTTFGIFESGLKTSKAEVSKFIRKAQKKGFVRKGVDCDIAASSFAHLVVTPARTPFLMDLLPELDVRNPGTRKKFLDQTLDLFFSGIT